MGKHCAIFCRVFCQFGGTSAGWPIHMYSLQILNSFPIIYIIIIIIITRDGPGHVPLKMFGMKLS